MLGWYQVKVNYWALLEGKKKLVPEVYAVHCLDFGDAQYTVTGLIQERIQQPDFDSIGRIRPADVYIKPSVSGVDSEFYFVHVEIEDVKKYVDIHLLNANSVKNAVERATARMKGSGHVWKIIKTERTKLLGIYDKLRSDLIEDFEARQQHLADLGKVEADIRQYNMFESDEERQERENRVNRKSEQDREDSEAITAIVVRNDVVSVEVEDLGNGQHGYNDEEFEAMKVLTGEAPRLLDAPTNEENTSELVDEEPAELPV